MRFKENHCPACNEELDGVAGVGERAVPVAGDLSVCWFCLTILTFTPTLSLEVASRELLLQRYRESPETMNKLMLTVELLRTFKAAAEEATCKPMN